MIPARAPEFLSMCSSSKKDDIIGSMGWFKLFAKISLLFKVASFKARVKQAQKKGRVVFIILFVVFTAALLWFGKGLIREARENYEDGKRRSELPVAQPFESIEPLELSTELLPAPNEESEDSAVVQLEIEEAEKKLAEVFGDEIPNEKNLAVPFTSQAPHANWDLPYQETCEEASVYMVSRFFDGDQRLNIPKEEADAELLKLVEWQKEKFGHYEDTSVSEVLNILKHYYGLTYRVINNPTVDDIKDVITQGYPIIVPAYGKALPNPFFSGDGPLYHMLVIKGYLEDRFITNDPGTRRGADFTYEFDHFMPAIHDWNGGDVQNGSSRVIVVTGRSS